jgi:hypothetical protein
MSDPLYALISFAAASIAVYQKCYGSAVWCFSVGLFFLAYFVRE